MAPQGGWDDDDDVPLSSFAAVKAAPAPAAPKPAAQAEGKKSKASKEKPNKKQAGAVGWGDVEKVLKARDAHKSSPKAQWRAQLQEHGAKVAVAVCVLAIIYFRISEESWTGGGTGDQQKQEDPFKVLGVPSSASDSEVKRAYHKLSLKLHPDKNPDATQEDSDRFARVAQAYKVLNDPAKKRRWLNNESPDHASLPSDTESLTDKQAEAQLRPKSAWLILAYADWSNECWDLAERWEQTARDLGRYVQVGRINIDKEKALAKRFNVMSVPMIYTYVDGNIQTFYGEPTHANLTLFLTRNLGDTGITLLRDSNGGSFLSERPEQVKAILFAQQGALKLRLAFRSFARKFRTSMDFGEATMRGTDKLRYLYGVTKEPAIVVIKEGGTKPYLYSGQMTHARLSTLFAQHQFDPVARLTTHNIKPLCGLGLRGENPCIVYLHDSGKDSEQALAAAKSAMRNASLEDQSAATKEDPERMSMAFAWIDLARHHKFGKLISGISAKAVALDARGKLVMPYEGDVNDARELLTWARHLASGTDSSDWDPLGGAIELSYEALPWYWRAELRRMTPHLMTMIAFVAILLLWYAVQNLYFDYRETKKRDAVKRNIDRTRQKQKQAESVKLTKWQQIEEANRQAAEAKRKEQEEKERRKLDAMREMNEEKEREARRAKEEAAKKAATQAAAQKAAAAQAPKAAPAPAVQPKEGGLAGSRAAPAPGKASASVSDADLCRTIEKLVASGDLNTLTKRAVREQLQAAHPQVDLLSRKDLIANQIEASVQKRLSGK